MKNSLFQRFTVILISACFFAGMPGVAYHDCNMGIPTEQEQAMAGMDCHKDAAAKTKKCCIDLSCLKCFSSPVVSFTFNAIEPYTTYSSAPFLVAYHLASRSSNAPERPPKIG